MLQLKFSFSSETFTFPPESYKFTKKIILITWFMICITLFYTKNSLIEKVSYVFSILVMLALSDLRKVDF